MTAQQTFRNTVVVLLTIFAAYAIYQSKDILIVLVVAIIIASSVRPAVMWLTRHHFPLGLAVLSVYLMLGVSLFALSALVIPPITNQLSQYINNDQQLANRLISAQDWVQTNLSNLTHSNVTLFDPEQIKSTVSQVITQIISSLPSLAGQFGSLLGDFVLVVVMGVYWLTARDQAVNFVTQLFSIGKRGEVGEITEEIENSLGTYIRGIMLVATFVGVANFCILTVFRVPNAITLGFIMGVTTILPLIGGYIGAGLATLLALLTSPINAVIAFGSFVAVQQVENHFLTPRVMSRSVGLDPILIIVFLFVGSALGGVVGALIAVPIAGTIMILLRHLVIEPRKSEAQPQLIHGGVLLENTSNKDRPANKDTDSGELIARVS